ncbi:sensor histidine kinase [Dinghuibacter silviterrae]|uniref:Histidine kinase n=1 Tax=Dinghuibacter silviterrae TaxID=1539049 RepID=A0A4R8DGC9_9BACT|nr:histidine kinase [Dinghuibacter silviterrae]TDW96304.1 histidine kinase [Dinghuibacter silviterrae]
MKPFFERASTRTLQWLIWIFVCLIIFVTYVSEDGWRQSGTYAVLHCLFYATLIYTNILVLFPRLYVTGRRTWYFICVAALILGLGVIRGFVYWWVYNTYFAVQHDEMLMNTIYSCILSNIFIYILSLVFRIALAYFGLKKQAQEILLQKSQAELNLLKSQVQPHFLFNTLNNIYYESYRESPRTALLIERLSEIMRYFVDESPKQYVQLSTEIRFLENYMALEQIRIRYGVHIRFTKECDPETRVPPMLLMTFVENIFKHGIDKTSPLNSVDLVLSGDQNRLRFRTRNKLHRPPGTAPGSGFGIKNLRERLRILFGEDFELDTHVEGLYFVAFLSIPVPCN